ncbi:MAG TPA: transglutaminaseTgpA domain-containing protein [Actinomycetota bacterium]|nr:transglutaminaseTgpA domain-containing protein [Actinomycetota bacterium]
MTREGESRLVLALALVAGATIFAYTRVFAGHSWLIPALAAAWGSLALTRGLVRLKVQPSLLVAVLLVAGAVLVLVVVFPSATLYGLPTGGAIRTALDAARAAEKQISAVTAPIPVSSGFLALAMAASWLAGCLSASLLGTTSQRRPEGAAQSGLSPSLIAPVPWIILFAVAAGVGQGGNRLVAVGVFFASVLAYLLAEGWSSIGHLPKLDGAVRLGVVSLAGALILPNVVPGYRSGPIFPWARLGPTTETTVSPLVQIKPFLLQQSNVTLFHVQASDPVYWRLTSLDQFTGQAWMSSGSYNAASGTLSSPAPGITNTVVRQSYHIASLGGIWVPAAFKPTRVQGLSTSLDQDSQTLIVASGSSLHPGAAYSVTSAAPEPTGDELVAAGAGTPRGAADTALPASTVAEIRPIVNQVVNGATGAYDQAVAVQDYLRSFTYDESVPAGSGTDYLYTFLTQTKRGYCEQFAGAMAVMLRILGIPSRVAVGFLPGTQGPGINGLADYTVTGKDAHAWPEAYFSGIGWVAFEPTPRPGLVPPAYTIPAQPVQDQQPPSEQPTPAATSPDTGPAAASPTTAPQSRHNQVPQPVAHHHQSAAERAAEDVVLLLVLGLALLFGAREARLRLPEWLARTPQEKAIAIYDEFALRAADAARSRTRGETVAEYARVVVQECGVPPAPVQAVTLAYQQAIYARQGPGADVVHMARAANRDLRRLLFRKATWRGRVRLALSPHPLFTRVTRSAPRGAPGYAR